MNIEERVAKLEARNLLVENNKAWETSKTRKFSIAILTYFTIYLVLVYQGVQNPAMSAIIPVLGFILSTLSVSLIRRVWERFTS